MAARAQHRRRRRAAAAQPPAPASELRPRAPVRVLRTAGAVAGAIGSLVALVVTVGGMLDRPPKPPGTVAMRILSTTPLTYGEWRRTQPGGGAGIAPAQRRTPGRLIRYDVTTNAYQPGVRLPVRFVVYGPTTRILAAGPLKIVRERDSCGCVDWVPTPPARAPYTIQVDVYAPGPIHGAPLRTASSRPFTAS